MHPEFGIGSAFLAFTQTLIWSPIPILTVLSLCFGIALAALTMFFKIRDEIKKKNQSDPNS